MQISDQAILATETEFVLRDTVSQYWFTYLQALFRWLSEELGPLSEPHKRFAQLLESVCVEQLPPGTRGSGPVCPPEKRAVLVRALMATAVFDAPITRTPVDQLRNDPMLNCLCG